MSSGLSTRKQVADYFGVSYDTVQNWQKKGIIKPFCAINGRPRYKLQDVINAVSKDAKEGAKSCN